MYTKVGFDTVPLTTGTKRIELGFRPKAIYFLANHDTENTLQADNAEVSFGMTDLTRSATYAMKMMHDTTAFPKVAYQSSLVGVVIELFDDAMSTDIRGAIDSVDDTGFTINFTIVTGTASRFAYLALGGSDILNARCDYWSYTPTVPPPVGSSEYVVNCGFRPTSVVQFSKLTFHDSTDINFSVHMTGPSYYYSVSGMENTMTSVNGAKFYCWNYPSYFSWARNIPQSATNVQGPTIGTLDYNNNYPIFLHYLPYGWSNQVYTTAKLVYYLALEVSGVSTIPLTNPPPIPTYASGVDTAQYLFQPRSGGPVSAQKLNPSVGVHSLLEVSNYTRVDVEAGLFINAMSSVPPSSTQVGAGVSFAFVGDDGTQACYYFTGYRFGDKDGVGGDTNIKAHHGQIDNLLRIDYHYAETGGHTATLWNSIAFDSFDYTNHTINVNQLVTDISGSGVYLGATLYGSGTGNTGAQASVV